MKNISQKNSAKCFGANNFDQSHGNALNVNHLYLVKLLSVTTPPPLEKNVSCVFIYFFIFFTGSWVRPVSTQMFFAFQKFRFENSADALMSVQRTRFTAGLRETFKMSSLLTFDSSPYCNMSFNYNVATPPQHS